MDGSLDEPVFSGSASIIGGRVRHFSMPNALDANQRHRLGFDARGIRLDEVTARMGEGPVQFGGRIGLDGYLPGELNITMGGAGHAPPVSRGHPIRRGRRPVPSAATSGRRRSEGW